jgi:branched-chain amino acid transport system permease protein
MNQMIINGLMLGMSYALIALGLTLIFGIMNIVNFAHGQMCMLGSFIMYYLYGVFHWNFFITLIICALILALVGAVFERFFLDVSYVFPREKKIQCCSLSGLLYYWKILH